MQGDEEYELPEGYDKKKKDVVGLLRRYHKKDDDEDIYDEFVNATDLDKIENQIFGRTIELKQDLFILR